MKSLFRGKVHWLLILWIPRSAIASGKEVIAMSVSYFCYGYVAYPFFFWFFTYLLEVRHVDRKASAIYGMLPALGTQVSGAPTACFVLAGGAGAPYLLQSSYWSLTAGLSSSSAGSVSGVMNICGQFGGVLTASLALWVAAHYGWTASFIMDGAMAICGSLAWLAVDPSRELALPVTVGVAPATAASRQAGPRV